MRMTKQEYQKIEEENKIFKLKQKHQLQQQQQQQQEQQQQQW